MFSMEGKTKLKSWGKECEERCFCHRHSSYHSWYHCVDCRLFVVSANEDIQEKVKREWLENVSKKKRQSHWKFPHLSNNAKFNQITDECEKKSTYHFIRQKAQEKLIEKPTTKTHKHREPKFKPTERNVNSKAYNGLIHSKASLKQWIQMFVEIIIIIIMTIIRTIIIRKGNRHWMKQEKKKTKKMKRWQNKRREEKFF